MLQSEIKSEIINLGMSSRIFKPHKYIALATAIKILKENNFTDNKVYFSENYKRIFSDIFSKYSSDADRNRSYTPFFHLKTSSFWSLVAKLNMERVLESTTTVGGPTALTEIVEFAELSNSFMDILRNDEDRSTLEGMIYDCLALGCTSKNQVVDTEDTNNLLNLSPSSTLFSNEFVRYLNSLQRLGAGNENALAESQACNPHFSTIHVAHPLTQTILAELGKKSGRHVILTGHAGDGKSTIAFEVYKHLAGIPANQALVRHVKPREDISGDAISIIKDLSERHKADDNKLLEELVKHENRFLLVTNTGTLLDLFREHSDFFSMNDVNLESAILNAISDERGEGVLTLGSTDFQVFNLARMDNLHIARQIFERMLSPERWTECSVRDCRHNCPIYFNVNLIQCNEQRVMDRIFLAYRRMYEYGTRMTMRQLTEHLAYLVTSGLEETDIEEMRQKDLTPLKTEYMFFNRFFGDNGRTEQTSALQMQAICKVRQQGFGERPCPSWERRLWLRSHGQKFVLGVDGCEIEFESLRKHGSKSGNDNRHGMTPDQAREQVRRMLYFLYEFSKEHQSYLSQYLNSPSLLRWHAWQEPFSLLDSSEKFVLEHRIYHVLQEHFSGVRLPEGSIQHDRRLYVTLNRRRGEVRQSAQVVLAQVDWSTATNLDLGTVENASGGKRTDLILKGLNRIEGVSLHLTLPFLDYVVMRHFGELGEVLQTSYLERLDRFKAHVLKLASTSKERIMLVRLKTDHTFRRQHYAVNNGNLEVNDVL